MLRCIQCHQSIAKVGAGYEYASIDEGTEAVVTEVSGPCTRVQIEKSHGGSPPKGTELMLFETTMWEALLDH